MGSIGRTWLNNFDLKLPWFSKTERQQTLNLQNQETQDQGCSDTCLIQNRFPTNEIIQCQGVDKPWFHNTRFCQSCLHKNTESVHRDFTKPSLAEHDVTKSRSLNTAISTNQKLTITFYSHQDEKAARAFHLNTNAQFACKFTSPSTKISLTFNNFPQNQYLNSKSSRSKLLECSKFRSK